MKIISVVIICEEYPPNVAGGLGVHYFELINELKNLCEVNLITARTNKNTKEKKVNNKIETTSISSRWLKLPSSLFLTTK